MGRWKFYLQCKTTVMVNHMTEDNRTHHKSDDKRRLKQSQVNIRLIGMNILLDEVIDFYRCTWNNTSIDIIEKIYDGYERE